MSRVAVHPRAVVATATTIAGPAGDLEAEIDRPQGDATTAVAVVCHPHPLQGGTMRNKVVTTLARSFARLGMVAARFNFRGVGASGGRHDGGDGETADTVAVVDWARAQWPGRRLYIAGFSFGAAIALRAAAARAPQAVVTVAPALRYLPAALDRPRARWLLVQGADDDIVATAAVLDWARRFAPPPEIAVIAGAGHFFHGRLNAVAGALAEFCASQIPPGSADAGTESVAGA